MRKTSRYRTPSIGPWLFAAFLTAGYFKADPRLSFLQMHVDLTLFFLLLSIAVFAYEVLRNRAKLLVSRSFLLSSLLFIVLTNIVLASLLCSQSWNYGFQKAARFMILTGWAFLGGGLLITDHHNLRQFSWAIVVISSILAIDAFTKVISDRTYYFVTAFGSNYIALTRAGGLGLLATIAFLLPIERRPMVRFCLWVIAALLFWVTLIGGARGPVLSLVISLLLFFALSVKGFPRVKIDRFALRLSVTVFFVFLSLAVVGQMFFPVLFSRIHIALTEGGYSLFRRLYLYRSAVDLWAKSPIWGIGTGGFGLSVIGVDTRLYPHNIILELGAETGLIGVLIFVSLIVIAFGKGFSYLYCERRLIMIMARYLLVVNCFALLNAMMSGDINDNRWLFSLLALMANIPMVSTVEESCRAVSKMAFHSKGHLGR